MRNGLMAKVVVLWRREWRRLFSFGLVGLTSLGLVVSLYGLFTRVIWPEGPHTFLYSLIVVFAGWVNYELNRHFTFDARLRTAGSMGRFATVAVIVAGLYSVLFWLGHEILGFWDYGVIVVNQVCVGVFTFTSHRVFTFHDRPWRFLGRK